MQLGEGAGHLCTWGRGTGSTFLGAVSRNELTTLTVYGCDGRKVTRGIIKKGDVTSAVAERLFLWPRPIKAGGMCVYAGAALSRNCDLETASPQVLQLGLDWDLAAGKWRQ